MQFSLCLKSGAESTQGMQEQSAADVSLPFISTSQKGRTILKAKAVPASDSAMQASRALCRAQGSPRETCLPGSSFAFATHGMGFSSFARSSQPFPTRIITVSPTQPQRQPTAAVRAAVLCALCPLSSPLRSRSVVLACIPLPLPGKQTRNKVLLSPHRSGHLSL